MATGSRPKWDKYVKYTHDGECFDKVSKYADTPASERSDMSNYITLMLDDAAGITLDRYDEQWQAVLRQWNTAETQERALSARGDDLDVAVYSLFVKFYDYFEADLFNKKKGQGTASKPFS